MLPRATARLFRVGRDVKVTVLAFPDRVFEGKITTIGATVDPNTHRLLVRSEIKIRITSCVRACSRPFIIRTGDPVRSLAVPLDGVVREGDGTMTVWVTTDRRRFIKRTVKIGLQRDGYRQILEGCGRANWSRPTARSSSATCWRSRAPR